MKYQVSVSLKNNEKVFYKCLNSAAVVIDALRNVHYITRRKKLREFAGKGKTGKIQGVLADKKNSHLKFCIQVCDLMVTMCHQTE